jgi:starch-binding outer membrane protein SusE/F
MRLRLLFSILLSAFATIGFAQVTAVGLIGPATPNGWPGPDSDLTQDATDTAKWSVTMRLTAGECKFRANDAWDLSWGATDFPAGVGITANGPNIKVPFSGNYLVTFNHVTGEYNFSVISRIGIIGDATPGGWAADTDMYQDELDTNSYFLTLPLVAKGAKFRLDNDWAVSWGGATFPAGVGDSSNGPNINISSAGNYRVTFNKLTEAYNFEEIKAYNTIGIIGTSTGGGTVDVDLTKTATNPDIWAGQADLSVGSLVFRANDSTAVMWGDTTWPAGFAKANGPGVNVKTAGKYLIVLNTKTGEYKFFQTVGIIGDATPGGWGASTQLTQDAADKFLWKGRMDLTSAEAKFRADNDWKISWGGATFPEGIAVSDGGANIPVSAGDYKVEFHSATGVYKFELVVAYDSIGLIGEAGPTAGWDTDAMMKVNPADEFHFILPSATLTNAATDASGNFTGGVKFRANKAWDTNWGSIDFPSGIGTQNGANIRSIAGTYKVELNTLTGAYAFGPVSSTYTLLDESVLALSPNPASSWLNLEVRDAQLQGETQVRVYDATGRLAMNTTVNVVDNARIDVTSLTPGQYLVNLSNGKYMVSRMVAIQR